MAWLNSQHVTLKAVGTPKRLPKWLGPFKILAKPSRVNYVLDTCSLPHSHYFPCEQAQSSLMFLMPTVSEAKTCWQLLLSVLYPDCNICITAAPSVPAQVKTTSFNTSHVITTTQSCAEDKLNCFRQHQNAEDITPKSVDIECLRTWHSPGHTMTSEPAVNCF